MTRASSPRSRSLQSAHRRLPDHPPAPPRDRLLRPRRRADASSCARTASSSTSTATRTAVPELVGMPRPASCCSTTTTSPTRRSGSTTPRSRSRSSNLAAHRGPARPRARLGLGLGLDARRRGRRRRDYVDLVLGNIATETESTTMRIVARPSSRRSARTYVAPETRDADDPPGRRRALAARTGGRGRHRRAVPVREVLREHRVDRPSTSTHPERPARRHDAARRARDRHRPRLGAARGPRAARRCRRARDRRPPSTKDNTANGQQAAARARATIATRDGKQRRLDAALIGRRRSRTRSLRNMGLGFQHVNDPDSLETIVAALLRGARAGLEGAQLLDRRSTSSWASTRRRSPRSTSSTRPSDWLAANHDVPALRRLVIENLAGVERALKAQARDAKG